MGHEHRLKGGAFDRAVKQLFAPRPLLTVAQESMRRKWGLGT